MFIAKQRRKENIAEYILYIWQLEDLFRAMQFNNNIIWEKVIEPQENLTEEQKEQTLYWYVDIINLLKSEGKVQSGHIEHTTHLISDLNDLHLQLLKLPVGEAYAMRYKGAAHDIAILKEKLEDKSANDIEVCFKALYSVILLRLKGNDAAEAHINDVLQVISPLIAHLTSIFHAIERGEINLFAKE